MFLSRERAAPVSQGQVGQLDMLLVVTVTVTVVVVVVVVGPSLVVVVGGDQVVVVGEGVGA